jgi:IclR family transcriptional regulator, mhp operon transcriptional activator
MVGRRRCLVRSALGKAILAASPSALRQEMLDMTASLVAKRDGLDFTRHVVCDGLFKEAVHRVVA